MKADFPYRGIGPRTSHVLGRDSLWLGAGHLLAVHNNHFVESYLRFDLREIQAMVIRKQFRFVVPVYWLLGCIAAFVVAIAGTSRGNGLLTDIGWGVLLLLGIYWLAASLAGSCSCHLQTAVDTYELPGLYRYRSARRAFDTLAARIAEVQGILPEDWNADDSGELSRAQEAVPESLSSALFPGLACVALFMDALISWVVRGPNHPRILETVGMVVTLIAVVLPIVAVVVTRRDKRFQPIRILFMVAVFAVGFANYGNTLLTTFVTTLQRAGQAAPMAGGIGNFLYWVNQIAEVSVGLLVMLGLLGMARGSTPGRESSAP